MTPGGQLMQQPNSSFHVSIVRVVPKVIEVSNNFKHFDFETRNCKFLHESKQLKYVQNYSKAGCEFECALEVALDICKCLPWFYPNDFSAIPMCDMFGGKCFDKIMSDNTYYKNCNDQCLEDCEVTSYIAFPSYVPLDITDICRKPLFQARFINLQGLFLSILYTPFISYHP